MSRGRRQQTRRWSRGKTKTLYERTPGLVSLFDASYGVTPGTGPDVNSWAPRYGSDRTAAVQSGADALKPHVSAADADFGGHDAIAFDGSDDFLERLGVSFSTDWTIIFAALKTDLTATQMLLSAAESPAGSTDSMALAYSVTTGAPAVWWDGGAIATSTVGLRPSAATAFVASVRYADAGGSTANVTFRTGGSEEVEVASGYVPAGWDEEVFCCRRKDAANSMYWGGKIALFGRWSRALTDAECDALEAEMKAAVGL